MYNTIKSGLFLCGLVIACLLPGCVPKTSMAISIGTTDAYHFGSGGPITQESLEQMKSQDSSVAKQIAWLKGWRDWYEASNPNQRPMFSDEAYNDIVFYEWKGSDGSVHYKVAWKFDRAGYPGHILLPPAINWEGLNPPITAPKGHDIGPGQGPVMISLECTDGSDLAKMGVPVGAQLAVEPGTGDWVMVYNDQVFARIDNKGVWQEPLGGGEVAYLYDGMNIPMPEGVKALLTPLSPDTWKQTGWYFTDGTPYPWGEPIVAGSDDQLLIVVPSFVRGVVEIPEPQADVGGKVLFVVLAAPADGGSNFIILNFQDNKYATYATFGISRLVDGKVPLNWAQSSWENPMDNEDFVSSKTFTGLYNGRQITDKLKQYVGQMVMVSFRPSAEDVDRSCLRQIVEGTLINQDGQSGVDTINPLVGLTLP